jgi:mRNA interferase RelE/StbE
VEEVHPQEDLRKLPPSAEECVVEAVEDLAENPFPHGVEKLSGSQHAYRIRLGDYRVVLKSPLN